MINPMMTRGEHSSIGRSALATTARPPVNQRTDHACQAHCDAENTCLRDPLTHSISCELFLGFVNANLGRIICGSVPATIGETLRPPQMLLWPANRSSMCMAHVRPSTGYCRSGRTRLVGKNYGHSRSLATSAGIAVAIGPTWPKRKCLRPLWRHANSGQADATTAKSIRPR